MAGFVPRLVCLSSMALVRSWHSKRAVCRSRRRVCSSSARVDCCNSSSCQRSTRRAVLGNDHIRVALVD